MLLLFEEKLEETKANITLPLTTLNMVERF